MEIIPYFTVLLPAKGRPGLVRDALVSVLEQSYRDFEVIISNNGADPAVRAAIADKLEDPRVRYIEQQKVLPMPEHWEQISLLSRGRYVTVLPDRSVLKQGALDTIAKLHADGGTNAAIVTWSWDLYYEDLGLLLPFAGSASEPVVLESISLALNTSRLDREFPYSLPRGLNSSVSLDLIKKIRASVGAAFLPISPDFSFAYNCLMCHPYVIHIDRSLMISQGLNISNGGNAYRADASSYIATLGLQEPIRYSPINAMFVENSIAEDFFAACHRFGRQDILLKFDMSDLYLKCLIELDEKRFSGILQSQHIQQLACSIETALAKEAPAVQNRVNALRNQSFSFRSKAYRILKRMIGTRVKYLQPILLRLRGGRHFSSILAASGFHNS